jgi:hypothetical protein
MMAGDNFEFSNVDDLGPSLLNTQEVLEYTVSHEPDGGTRNVETLLKSIRASQSNEGKNYGAETAQGLKPSQLLSVNKTILEIQGVLEGDIKNYEEVFVNI